MSPMPQRPTFPSLMQSLLVCLAASAVAWFAMGCTAAPAATANPLAAIVARHDRAEDVMSAGLGDRVAAVVLAAGSIHGVAQITHGATACSGDGNPIVTPVKTKPRAGARTIVEWTTAPTSPPAMPPYECWLLVALRPSEPIALAPFGLDGCYLLVLPDWVLRPQPGSILMQEGGTVRLDWVPDQTLVGSVWRLQLLVGYPTGYRLSPALTLTIGNLP